MIASKEIKMSGKKMFSLLFLQNGMPWAIIILVGFFICLILGFAINFRFFFLSLIWIFIVAPMGVLFMYFYYGMKPLTAFNTVSHKIKFEESDILIDFINNDENNSEAGNKSYKIENSSFDKLILGSDYILLSLKSDGWLWLPVYGFDKIEDFKSVIKKFTY